ncbi:hypothetical protein EVAR_55140_1 [Eumeta japonica]|uniref:Uncharacterized protein n=1 Tax=Eumeta variegata TaxID=151549 RepID=A0A4C1YC17_EUMVA|nr:hypothetical protein EVAR_55140_1 [Eumeta japonica]
MHEGRRSIPTIEDNFGVMLLMIKIDKKMTCQQKSANLGIEDVVVAYEKTFEANLRCEWVREMPRIMGTSITGNILRLCNRVSRLHRGADRTGLPERLPLMIYTQLLH